jgi:hypothetical protein
MNRLKTMFLGDETPARSSAQSPVLAEESEQDGAAGGMSQARRGSRVKDDFHSRNRFEIYEDGVHAHYLRTSKQKETLKTMINDLFKAKNKRDGAVSAVPQIVQGEILA